MRRARAMDGWWEVGGVCSLDEQTTVGDGSDQGDTGAGEVNGSRRRRRWKGWDMEDVEVRDGRGMKEICGWAGPLACLLWKLAVSWLAYGRPGQEWLRAWCFLCESVEDVMCMGLCCCLDGKMWAALPAKPERVSGGCFLGLGSVIDTDCRPRNRKLESK